MVFLRATRKVLRYLSSPILATGLASSTALGDWYVNRIVVDRQPLLLILSARSLLTLLVPARDVAGLPTRLSALVATRLRQLGIATPLIQAEVTAMEPVVTAPTCDRSVLGYLTDFGKSVPSYLPIDGWDVTTLPYVESRLAETPCHLGGTIFPELEGPRLLAAAWPSAPTTGATLTERAPV